MLQVALKTIKPAVAGGRPDIERFLREARILCQMRHPNIISFQEVGEAADGLWFAMDYVQERTLMACCAKGALSRFALQPESHAKC